MTNKVTITVTGPSGSGKTTIADLLYDFLSEQGFVTGQISFEDLDLKSRERHKEARIQSVKDNTMIIIDEKQAKRSNL